METLFGNFRPHTPCSSEFGNTFKEIRLRIHGKYHWSEFINRMTSLDKIINHRRSYCNDFPQLMNRIHACLTWVNAIWRYRLPSRCIFQTPFDMVYQNTTLYFRCPGRVPVYQFASYRVSNIRTKQIGNITAAIFNHTHQQTMEINRIQNIHKAALINNFFKGQSIQHAFIGINGIGCHAAAEHGINGQWMVRVQTILGRKVTCQTQIIHTIGDIGFKCFICSLRRIKTYKKRF